MCSAVTSLILSVELSCNIYDLSLVDIVYVLAFSRETSMEKTTARSRVKVLHTWLNDRAFEGYTSLDMVSRDIEHNHYEQAAFHSVAAELPSQDLQSVPKDV